MVSNPPPVIKDDSANADRSYENPEVVCDANHITSRTPDHLLAVYQTILAAMCQT